MFDRAKILHKLAGLANIGYWIIDAENNIYWDDSMYHLYGLSSDCGKSPEDFEPLVYKEDYPLWKDIIEESIGNRTPFSVDARVLIEDRYQWVHIQGSPDKDGSMIGYTQNIDRFYRTHTDLRQTLKRIRLYAFNNQKGLDLIKKELNLIENGGG